MAESLPTVVLVDDAPEVRTLVRARLRLSRRFDVVGEGSDGIEAIELARLHQPSLLVLDVSMPRMDGIGALPHVLAASPRTRVVMYSGFDEQGLAKRAVQLGAAGFLEKSTAIDTLPDDLAALLGDDSAPAHDVATAGDVPDTAVLAEHLERFREVFEEAAIGMATMTLTGHVVRANRALAEILGCPLDTIVGASYADLAVPADATDVVTTVESVGVDSPDVLRLEHGVVVDNSHRRVLATIAPVRDSRRRPLYLFLQVQDVTAQRHAEEQLRQSEERFRLLVETVEDYAIFMLDPAGHVASWNAGAQRIKGYTADEIIGAHFRMFYPVEVQRIGHPEAELEIALARGHYEEEGWRIRKDGTRFWANVVITAIRNADGEHIGFAKVTRDITERQQMLQDRERAADALAIVNRELELMNARLSQAASDQAQFLAVTAHELRGPVGLLGGSATTLAQHWTELTDDERDDMLAAMVSSAGRLRRLLADLLTASRLEAGAIELEPTSIRLNEVADAVVMATRAPDAVTVDSRDDVTVHADADRLAQALENLVSNGLIHGAPPVRIVISRDEKTGYLRVFDDGPGVDEDLRDRLFARFSTSGRKGGTGLGLFIVRELARAHGGDAWYDAASAEGPCFVIAVPRTDTDIA